MKRSWIGAGLLLVLLLVGICSTWRMQRCQEPMAENIRRAGTLAAQNDWAGAESCAAQTRQAWEKCWDVSAALTDHEPMEEVDALFETLEVYAGARDGLNYAALCAQLGSMLEAMGEAHSFRLRNLL